MTALPSVLGGKTDWAGYRLGHRRGLGSFGKVWEAEAPDGRAVAFKTVECKPGVAAHEVRNTRHVCEFKHPNVVHIEKVWCERDHLIFVMELGDGSLHDLAEVSRAEFGLTLPAPMLVNYFRQAAEAIDFLNARTHLISGRRVGVQHRDVKPSNMLLFGDKLKLCDFGLAAMTIAPMIRQGGAGTPAFAAPEVFRGWLSDWTDQYALAVSYCLLRGGRLPFTDAIVDFRPDYVRPAPDLNMLDAPERPILARALAPIPQDRWPTCAEMVRQLLALVASNTDGNLPERREGTRHACPANPVVRIVTCGKSTGFKGTIVNVSERGAGIVLDRPIGVGVEFMFLLNLGPSDARLISARVMRGTLQPDGRWFAGCKLSLPLSDSDIQKVVQMLPPAAT